MSLIIFDTETGGLLPRNPTIQIGAIAVDADWTEVAAFETKIQFNEADCDPEALKMNSYDPEVWKRDAISPFSAVTRFGDFLRDHADLRKVSPRTGNPYTVARLCGHNIAGFDLQRVSDEFRKLNAFFPADYGSAIDTLQLHRWLRHINAHLPGPDSGRLTDIASFYGIAVDGAHDALADCRLVAAIAPKLLAEVITCRS